MSTQQIAELLDLGTDAKRAGDYSLALRHYLDAEKCADDNGIVAPGVYNSLGKLFYLMGIQQDSLSSYLSFIHYKIINPLADRVNFIANNLPALPALILEDSITEECKTLPLMDYFLKNEQAICENMSINSEMGETLVFLLNHIMQNVCKTDVAFHNAPKPYHFKILYGIAYIMASHDYCSHAGHAVIDLGECEKIDLSASLGIPPEDLITAYRNSIAGKQQDVPASIRLYQNRLDYESSINTGYPNIRFMPPIDLFMKYHAPVGLHYLLNNIRWDELNNGDVRTLYFK